VIRLAQDEYDDLKALWQHRQCGTCLECDLDNSTDLRVVVISGPSRKFQKYPVYTLMCRRCRSRWKDRRYEMAVVEEQIGLA
jgi:hypothetical protein